MMDVWQSLWQVVWYGGLAVFSVLTVMVIAYGAKDLVSLFRSLAGAGKTGRGGGAEKA